MKKKYHMSINVKGALKFSKFKEFEYDDGTPMPPKEAKAIFLVADFEGKRVLPMSGEPCEGWSYETGCPGHELPENT